MTDLHLYLNVNEDLKNAVRKSYNKTKEDIQQDIQIIYEWWNKQPHLPIIKDDEYIERILLKNKFRIEQTKRKIDAYFTLKGLHPEFLPSTCSHSSSADMKKMIKSNYCVPLKHSVNEERIILFKVKDSNADLFDFQFFVTHLLVSMELFNQYDYASSIRIIVDGTDLTIAMLTKMQANTFLNGLKMFQEGFSGRVAGVNYFNAPSFINIAIKILELGLKDNKVRVFGKIEDLFEIVPQKYWPEEYGGEGGKLDDLQKDWLQIIDENKEFIEKRLSLISNEKLRVGKSPYSEVFGTEGTFKKINID